MRQTAHNIMEDDERARSLRQNAWYWSALIQPYFLYLVGRDPSITRPDEAHEMLKERFGVESTTAMNTAEFSTYCDKCRAYLWNSLYLMTYDPEGRAFQDHSRRRTA